MRKNDPEERFGEMMTVAEVAAFLNLNEKIIYRLVREGKLPGTKVTGKWTFPRNLVRQWMEANALKDVKNRPAGPGIDSSKDLFFSGSNDLVIEHIGSVLLRRHAPESIFYVANTGSLQGLRAISLGKAHMAGIHLYSPEEDAYNTPFVRKYAPGIKAILFNVSHRRQGLMLRDEDSGRITGINDICGRRLINREAGSGTRLLLDLFLDREGIDPFSIDGYGDEVSTHLEVGMSILRGDADVGLGIEPVAGMLGLHFIPLARERYDIVVPVEYITLPPMEAFLRILQSSELKKELSRLPGYDFTQTGMIMR